MTTVKPLNVLFLCSHNAARSILAEALLNHLGGDRFHAFSAGTNPQPDQQPHPFALDALRIAGVSTDGLRSKTWDEFSAPDAPHMDLIVTVCDDAADETCPVWPGHPATVHWGYADPLAVKGSDEARHAAFNRTLVAIRQRLELFVNLPTEAVDKLALQQAAHELAQG